jgi:hypothetical protein
MVLQYFSSERPIGSTGHEFLVGIESSGGAVDDKHFGLTGAVGVMLFYIEPERLRAWGKLRPVHVEPERQLLFVY